MFKLLPFRITSRLGVAYNHTKSVLKYGDWYFPQVATIETSQACNRKCHYCPVAYEPAQTAFMEDSVFEKSISRLAEIRWTGQVSFQLFGEPLLNKRILERIQYVVRELPKALPAIVTNGDRLDVDMADRLVAAGTYRIIVSRHPSFSEAWDSRISGVYQKYPGIVQVIEVGKTWAKRRHGGYTWAGEPWGGYCIAPDFCIVIRINGDIDLCCSDFRAEVKFGNILDKPIMDIWYSHPFVLTRWELRNNIRSHSICQGCSGVQ